MFTRLRHAGALALALMLVACETNPATGERTFTAFMPASQEAAICQQEDPKVKAEFGGEYKDAELQRYVRSIGQLLAKTSELPELEFKFTVLDSDIVNAFALPGGCVYVTRGLVALAENEAELAGVMAHEIGHVTARHSAQRQSRGAIAGLGAAILGVLTGNPQLGNLAGVGAQAYLQSYSRDQEFEADELGIRYLQRAGYDTAAMATFLAKMEQHTTLESRLAGRANPDEGFDFLATHPRTHDRLERALEAARAQRAQDPMTAKRVYFEKIDGMIFGDNPDQGVVRERAFIHPGLGFRFEVPPGFRLINGQRQVLGKGPNGSAIIFDHSGRASATAPDAYIAREWAPNAQVREVERFEVNGLPAATALARGRTQQGGGVDARLVAIQWPDGGFYRFVFVSPPNLTSRLDGEFQRTAHSFRALSQREAASIQPQRLRIVEVRSGDTVETLSRQMRTEAPRERFMMLNGLQEGDRLQPGELVKVVQ